MIHEFYNEAAGKKSRGAAVIACASGGDFARFNPHLHAIFLEGGFDREERLIHALSEPVCCGQIHSLDVFTNMAAEDRVLDSVLLAASDSKQVRNLIIFIKQRRPGLHR